MKFTKAISLALFLLIVTNINGQVFPVQVNPQLTPPYSPYLSDYTAPDAQNFMVQVLTNDITLNHYLCRFRITIEGVGITIRTKQSFVPRARVLEGGGFPQIFYGDDLAEYFNPNALDFSGITQREYEKSARLPEGVYRFTVEILDYHRGTVVSNKGMAMAWIIINDPPLLNLPANFSEIKIPDPTNILFTWTPRHTASPNAAFTTEYTFRLVPLWPENRNPYDAFLTQPPLYETTTIQPRLLYGPGEPALIPGRKYAWQVAARDTEGRDLFRNKGRSEIFVFQFGQALAVPENLHLRWAKPTTLAIRWDAIPSDGEEIKYRLQYRPRKRDEDRQWYQTRTQFTEKTLYNLQSDKEYEVRVRAEKVTQESEYTETLIFKTLRQENLFVCKDNAAPPPLPENTLPLFPLSVNDTIHAGGYDVLVRDVIAMDGKYYGSGLAIVPWFNSAKVRVTFEKIGVNDRFWLTTGTIKSVWSVQSEFLLHTETPLTPASTPQAGELDITLVAADTLITIAGTAIATVTKDEEGNIVVTTTDGVDQTLPKGESYAIVDEAGNGYIVDKKGNIAQTTATQATAAAQRGNKKYHIAFRFEKGDGQFGFDEKKYDALAKYYQQLEDGTYVAWKALSSSEPDVIQARRASGEMDIRKIRFESGSIPVVPTSSAGGNFRLRLQGKMQGVEEALLVLYSPADTLPDEVVGMVNLASYNRQTYNLVIVPVNGVTLPPGVDIENISQKLNSVYGQAIVDWKVSESTPVSVDLGESFDDGETGLFSNYTTDMKKVLKAFGRLQDNTYYLFLVDKPRHPGTLGYMPRNKQAGFIFIGPHAGDVDEFMKTIAHELGHGAFNLKHTFREHSLPSGATDNVMDYSKGSALYKYQWDYIHDPQPVIGLFEGDDENTLKAGFAGFETAFINKAGENYKGSNCLNEAVIRGFEVADRFDFEVAAYSGFIRLMLCETRKENCDQQNDLGAFACGLSNGLLQEVDWITMLESVEGWSVNPEETLLCILESFPIGESEDNPELNAIVFKCLSGIELQDLTGGIKDFITTNWDEPYYQGQATAFALTLLTPFKGKILTKLEDLPKFAGKINDFRSLARAGSSDELVRISRSLVNSVRKFTAKQIDDYVRLATKNADARKVMLGKYDKGSSNSYIQRAGEEYTYFDMGQDKWREAESLVNNKDEMWKINKQFIDEQKKLGKEFYFSHEPWKAQSHEFLSFEAEYLIDIGAKDFVKINENTWKATW